MALAALPLCAQDVKFDPNLVTQANFNQFARIVGHQVRQRRVLKEKSVARQIGPEVVEVPVVDISDENIILVLRT